MITIPIHHLIQAIEIAHFSIKINLCLKKLFIILVIILFSSNVAANTPRSTGKYKNWESFTAETEKGKICFAQTVPTKRAPSSIKRGNLNYL